MKTIQLFFATAMTAVSMFAVTNMTHAAIPETDTLVVFDDYTGDDMGGIYPASFSRAISPSVFLPEGKANDTGFTDGRIALSTEKKHSGENALQFTWKSLKDGDWDARFGRNTPVKMAPFNIKKYKEICFYVSASARMAEGVFPTFHIQTTNNTISTDLDLVNYIDSTALMPNRWDKVVIPVSDIQKLQPTVNFRWDAIKLLGLSQNKVSKEEDPTRTMYIDNVFLVPDPNFELPSIATDTDPAVMFRNWSYAGQTAPSTLLLPDSLNKQGKQFTKLPISNSIKRGDSGNSVKISWNTAATPEGEVDGSWKALINMDDMSGYDLADEVTCIKFWIYSENALTQAAMPKIGIESHGNNDTAPAVLLSDYIDDLATDTWVEVVVPIADFKKISPDFAGYSAFKGVYFAPNAADAIQHTIYVDDMYLDDAELTGSSLSNTTEDIIFTAHYAQNVLKLSNSSIESCAIYSITGSLMHQATLHSGKVNISLIPGAYILRTEVGTIKLLVN